MTGEDLLLGPLRHEGKKIFTWAKAFGYSNAILKVLRATMGSS